MRGADIILIIVVIVAVGEAWALWQLRRRPAWWRRMDLHSAERLLLERFDGLESHLCKVAAGLHEDIDGLRQELRAMAALPPETKVPRLLAEVQELRYIVSGVGAALLAAAIIVWLALGAPAWAWTGA